jgi:hypothetical protein
MSDRAGFPLLVQTVRTLEIPRIFGTIIGVALDNTRQFLRP